MPSYFERNSVEISGSISDLICRKLARHRAVAALKAPNSPGPSVIVLPLVAPTVNMIHAAHENCVRGVGSSPLLPHLRDAYQRVLGRSSDPEDDQDFVSEIVRISLESTVRMIVMRTEEMTPDRNDPTNVLAAYTITNRLAEAMRPTRVTLTVDNVSDGTILGYFISPTGEPVPASQMRRATYEEYNTAVNSRLFDIDLKGVAGDDHDSEDMQGCVFYRTVGEKVLKKTPDGVLDSLEDDDKDDVDWGTLSLEMKSKITQAERSEVREYLANEITRTANVPIGKGRTTITGTAIKVTPEYITVDRQNIAFENIVDGPHSLEGRAALLIASAEIMREIEDAVAQSLLSAFSQGAFSSDTAKEIIAASQQK